MQLVQDQGGINDAWLFELVGNDTADKVGVSAVQVLHQLVQGFLAKGEGYNNVSKSLRQGIQLISKYLTNDNN